MRNTKIKNKKEVVSHISHSHFLFFRFKNMVYLLLFDFSRSKILGHFLILVLIYELSHFIAIYLS